MGKGKGKLDLWIGCVYPGTILIEFRHLRPGRAKYFSKQILHKINVFGKLVESSSKIIKLEKASRANTSAKRYFN